MNGSLIGYFYHADMVVKAVMLLLFTASIVSWMFIIQRAIYLKACQRSINDFEKNFWSTHDIASFYSSQLRQKKSGGLRAIFKEGFKAFLQAEQLQGLSPEEKVLNSERAMRVAIMKESNALEKHLSFLASVGSVSPYIGLFGTVWGIMNAFKALSNVQQVSIAMVAPGISEALIATAMGLFTAIPAVLAYNRYVNQVDVIQNHYDVFKSELSALLQRQQHHESH